MSSAVGYQAMNRALAALCGREGFTVKQLLQAACIELWANQKLKPIALALIAKESSGNWQIGAVGEIPDWATHTLVALHQETVTSGTEFRVVDHVVDGIRSFGTRIRRSIIVPLQRLDPLDVVVDGAVWIGLPQGEGLNQEFLAHFVQMGRDIGRWCKDSAPMVSCLERAALAERELASNANHLTRVVHDLKAPLAATNWQISECIRAGISPEEFSAVRDEIGYMERLLEQLLGKGRSLYGNPEQSGASLAETLERVVNRFRKEGACKGVGCQIGYGTIVTEERAARLSLGATANLILERILSNLVGNAVRYTPKGMVQIAAEESAQGVTIKVEDTGGGIPEEVLKRLSPEPGRNIVEPGRNAIESGRSVISNDFTLRSGSQGGPQGGLGELEQSQAGGWGVGLHSVVASASQLQGTIQFGRSLCGGSSVSLLLPIALFREEPAQVAKAAVEVVRSSSVPTDVPGDYTLLIDDDVTQANSLRRALVAQGVSCRVVGSVKDALALIASDPPNTVLCDCHMPEGGAVSLLEALDCNRNSIRVGIMSGDTTDDSIYMCASKGAEAFFSKPVELRQVAEWVATRPVITELVVQPAVVEPAVAPKRLYSA